MTTNELKRNEFYAAFECLIGITFEGITARKYKGIITGYNGRGYVAFYSLSEI